MRRKGKGCEGARYVTEVENKESWKRENGKGCSDGKR